MDATGTLHHCGEYLAVVVPEWQRGTREIPINADCMVCGYELSIRRIIFGKRARRAAVSLLLLCTLIFPVAAWPWNNGQTGNTITDQVSECDSVPYATHDWIPDHAVALLPQNERAWIEPHKMLYLLGTEAPDNRNIPKACRAPNTGYDATLWPLLRSSGPRDFQK